MTKSLEDYLEVIGNLAEENNNPRVKDIAERLSLTKPSVHVALHTLEERGMIKHEHYGAITLTNEGNKAYTKIKEKHDILTSFLEKIVGVNHDIAEKDGCAMEHIISDETFSNIKKMLKQF